MKKTRSKKSRDTVPLNWKTDLVLPVSGSQDKTVEAVEQHGKVLVLILGDLQLQFLHINVNLVHLEGRIRYKISLSHKVEFSKVNIWI
jgi:hypothetical protein